FLLDRVKRAFHLFQRQLDSSRILRRAEISFTNVRARGKPALRFAGFDPIRLFETCRSAREFKHHGARFKTWNHTLDLCAIGRQARDRPKPLFQAKLWMATGPDCFSSLAVGQMLRDAVHPGLALCKLAVICDRQGGSS